MKREMRIAVSLCIINDAHCGECYEMNEDSAGCVRCSECGKVVGNIVNSIKRLGKNQLSLRIITVHSRMTY